jgi:hypothetical protein
MTTDILCITAVNSGSIHLGIIGYRNGIYAMYIASQDFGEDSEDDFRPLLHKITDLTNVNLVVTVIAQKTFVNFFGPHQQA